MPKFVDTSEVNRLAVDLGKAPEGVTRKAGQAIGKTAHDIERDAKLIVPVDTGFLRNSITSDIDPLSAEIGPTAKYGEYVEDGTSRQEPQPYMRPAYDRNKDGLVRALEQIVGDFL